MIDAQTAEQMGIAALVMKPMVMRQLSEVVRHALDTPEAMAAPAGPA